MKTIFEAIKKFPNQFKSTVCARFLSTPNITNAKNHNLLAMAIELEDWDSVKTILELDVYRKPLEGVVYCLETYSDIDNKDWLYIVELFEENKIV